MRTLAVLFGALALLSYYVDRRTHARRVTFNAGMRGGRLLFRLAVAAVNSMSLRFQGFVPWIVTKSMESDRNHQFSFFEKQGPICSCCV